MEEEKCLVSNNISESEVGQDSLSSANVIQPAYNMVISIACIILGIIVLYPSIAYYLTSHGFVDAELKSMLPSLIKDFFDKSGYVYAANLCFFIGLFIMLIGLVGIIYYFRNKNKILKHLNN